MFGSITFKKAVGTFNCFTFLGGPTISVFRGRDYEINPMLSIRQPTIEEIEEYGEKKYFGIVRTLTATPADRKVEIWDSFHTYWDEIGEYELFILTFGTLQNEDMTILFPNVDFNSFRRRINPATKEFSFVNKDNVKIDMSVYTVLVDYLRSIHRMKKNRETGFDNITKDCMIEDDRYDMQMALKKPYDSVVLPFASCLALETGFSSVWDIPIGAFLYEKKRAQKVKNYENLMSGIYSGCVDTKKINKEDLNWLGSL